LLQWISGILHVIHVGFSKAIKGYIREFDDAYLVQQRPRTKK